MLQVANSANPVMQGAFGLTACSEMVAERRPQSQW